MKDLSVNYVVGFYIGSNRTYVKYQKMYKDNPLFFVHKHVDFLEKSSDITNATFVFNDDIDDELKQQINSIVIQNCNLTIIFRPNSGFSYGMWNDTIIRTINDNYDYYFLIEDDYIPTAPDFIKGYVGFFDKSICFVCGLVQIASHNNYPKHVAPSEVPFIFPSISNGLISGDACRAVFAKHNTVFNINFNNDYNSAYTNQIYFCKYFIDIGYKIVDVLKHYSSPYMNATEDNIVIYGEKHKPCLTRPIEISYD